MKVKTLMSSNLVTVAMDDDLAKVKSLFDENNFHHLLVVENEKLVGVISDRDLLRAISPNLEAEVATSRDMATLNKRVHQIMSRKLVCLDEDATAREAVDCFNTHEISCIAIVSDDQKPVGILSWRDVMKVLGHKK